MKIPLVDLKAQYAGVKPEVDAAIQRVLEHTGFIMGEEVANFERAFADYVKAKGAVGVASGTAALQLSLQACNVGPGDIVATTAHTFFATAEAISLVGARPLFVDIDPATYTLDMNQLEAQLKQHNSSGTEGKRIKAVIPVHLYGQPAHMDALTDLAQRYGFWIIEDAAQAHGAEYNGQRCGTIGHLACFSFYPGKNLGAYGDAGMVTGNDDRLLARIRSLRNHGRTNKYEHQEIGAGERLDALQAAILSAKLPHLEEWTEARRSHALLYNTMLANSPVITPCAAPQARHVYHLYVIRIKERDPLLTHLRAQGIDAGIHYPIPLHRQPAYRNCGYESVHLPHTEQAANEVLSLPIFPEMTQTQIAYVVSTTKEFFEQ
jgi:dTDP-4-amino-4,6-dideoxygalactose transaminase